MEKTKREKKTGNIEEEEQGEEDDVKLVPLYNPKEDIESILKYV